MTTEAKQRVAPLIEVPPIPWDFKNEVPAKTIDRHLLNLDLALEKSWGPEGVFFVDLKWIGEDERMSDGTHPMRYLFEQTRRCGLKAIPVTGFLRGDEYQESCSRIMLKDQRGVCIRLQKEDFDEDEGIDTRIDAILHTLGASPPNCDLLLDLGTLNGEKQEQFAEDLLTMIQDIPNLKKWRSFALAATGFPVDLMGLPPLQVSQVSRLEWPLWQRIAEDPRVQRTPTYADYAVASPQPSEVDPRIMRPSASIRYTAENSWLILKGQNLRDHGYQQFHDVSNHLVNASAYSGPRFSWGDNYINECARRRASCGNLTTWRKVGTSHHIAFVAQQLANFS